MRIIASVSGGKDSVAMWLWLRREGFAPDAVYVDTGWEWPGHHAYLDLLEQRIGPLTRIAAGMGMVSQIRHRGTFPKPLQRWCTDELKVTPFAAHLARVRETLGVDVTVAVGVRREESAKRAKLTPREWAPHYDCEVWRPLLDWTLPDVVHEHHRADIPLHPLYHHGAERVGCFPCVGASKAEIALVARIMPERIALIRDLETEVGGTMFVRDRRVEKRAAGDDGPSVVPIGVDEVVQWANTERGGKQLRLVPQQTGCARWGICERSPEGDE